MRLFIALNLPKKERQRIHRASRLLRDEPLPVRWIDPDNFHITLKFLGTVNQDRIPGVEEAIGNLELRYVTDVLEDFEAPARILLHEPTGRGNVDKSIAVAVYDERRCIDAANTFRERRPPGNHLEYRP